MILHHFTCRDSAASIRRTGLIVPNPSPMLPSVPAVVWLTDLPTANRKALGLESTILNCDRTEVRFTLDVDAEPWREFIEQYEIPRQLRRALERNRKPEHWFVTTQTLRLTAVAA